MFKFLLSFLFNIVLLLSAYAAAETAVPARDRVATIELATFPIPLMVENENSGIFIELLAAIEARIPYDIELSVYPTKRTLHLFEQQKVDGIFPALDVVINHKVMRSDNIYLKEDFAFVRRGQTIPKNINDLADKHIGLTAGYPYVTDVVAAAAKVSYAVNDYANVLKLDAGRIDVFIVEEKSGLQAIKASHLDTIVYDANNALSEQDVYFAFQDTENGAEFAAHFSGALKELKADGSFQRLMRKAGK